MPINGTYPIEINATPEQVWPWIAQIEKHGEWSPKPYKVELVVGTADTVGAKYRSVGWVPGDSNHGNEVTITEVTMPSRFALIASDRSGTFSNTYELKPTATGTEVVFNLVFPKLRGAAKYFAPLAFPIVGAPDIKKRMQLLKDKVEASK